MSEVDLVNIAPSSISTPASGVAAYFSSNASKRLSYKDDAGVTNPVGVPYSTYYVDDFGVTPANLAATNVTNLNTLLQSIAPTGSRIQFGAGTYQFSAGLTTLTKDFLFMGVRGQTTLAITAAMGSGVNFFTLNNTGYYSTFRDLNFVCFSAQTANYVIECLNDVNVEIADCFFTGAANWAGVIDFTGTNSGNGSIVKNVYISNFSGIGINVNSPLDTLYIEDIEILGGKNATSIGVSFSNGGAALMTDCQIVQCNINLQLAPTTGNTVSAVFVCNGFFDQGVTNCLLITGSGTGTVARCRFFGCWFTVSSSGVSPNCIQINSTGTGIHSGVEFDNCFIINATTGSTGTLNGLNATAVQDICVTNCQFSGWTNAITITPASAGTCSPLITGCVIGSTGLIATNTNGIVLNAGSFTYGTINIQGNTLNGNTTPLVDNSTQATTGQKLISLNAGLAVAPLANYAATAIPLTTVTNVDSRGGMLVPAGMRPSSVRILVYATNAATVQTLTATVRYGTANTNADAAVLTQAFVAGTAALGSGKFEFLIDISSATTLLASLKFFNGNNAATGISAALSLYAGLNAAATISTVANNWIGIYFSSATAAAITVRAVKYEVISQ